MAGDVTYGLYEVDEDNRFEAGELHKRLVICHGSLETTVESQDGHHCHCYGDGSKDLNLRKLG